MVMISSCACMRRDSGRKLRLPWTGPCKIIRRMSEGTYSRYIYMFSRKRRMVVHFDRLTLCQPEFRISTSQLSSTSSTLPPSPAFTKFNVTLLPPLDLAISSPLSRYPAVHSLKT